MSSRLDKFIKRIRSGQTLLGDGGWATQLQTLGLRMDGCPEEWNVTHPQRVQAIARQYIDAGSALILTNTFGGTKFRLQKHGMTARVRELNLAGAKLCREVVESTDAIVAGCVGPTGEFVQPHGPMLSEQIFDAFFDQIRALKEGGVDAICIETMYIVEEALLAIKAARAAGMYCIASMTFDATPEGYRTVLGTPVEESIRAIDTAGADIVGSNCGCGMAQMVRLAHRMALFTKKPLLVKANAGLPQMVDGRPQYLETPEQMAGRAAELKAARIAIIGGCCGTTPEHIRAFRAALDAAH
jgi:5-methyltetrahydrofolate--homocysteine methyltransferase